MLTHDIADGYYLALIEKRHLEQFNTYLENNRQHFTGILHFIDKVAGKDDVARIIESLARMLVDGTGFAWGLWHDNAIIGMVSVRDINEELKSAEIAYSIDTQFEGKGLVSKSCGVAIEYVFTEYDVERLVLGCDVKNTRSQNIARRYAFVNEGIARKGFVANGTFQDCYIFSLLREEYLHHRKNARAARA